MKKLSLIFSSIIEMDVGEVQELLETEHRMGPYKTVYSIYMYSILILSSFLFALMFHSFFGKHSKLNKTLRPIFMHSLCTSFLLTVIMCCLQVSLFYLYVTVKVE